MFKKRNRIVITSSVDGEKNDKNNAKNNPNSIHFNIKLAKQMANKNGTQLSNLSESELDELWQKAKKIENV